MVESNRFDIKNTDGPRNGECLKRFRSEEEEEIAININ
jgi:hypothetical protein